MAIKTGFWLKIIVKQRTWGKIGEKLHFYLKKLRKGLFIRTTLQIFIFHGENKRNKDYFSFQKLPFFEKSIETTYFPLFTGLWQEKAIKTTYSYYISFFLDSG